MAEAYAHNPADLQPEDAPSEVQLFDEEEGDGAHHPNDDEGGMEPEGNPALQPEDAPSEVEPFDEGPDEGAGPPPRGQNGRERDRQGRRPAPPSPPQRRQSRGRARNPARRDASGRANSHQRAQTAAERRDARRNKRDAYGRAKPRSLSMSDALFPFRPKTQYNLEVERVRRKVYRIPREEIGDPILRGHYRWHVSEYVRERRSLTEKRRIIVEGRGQAPFDALFDEITLNRDIHTWIAQKIVERRGGDTAPTPGEMKDRRYDGGVFCSFLPQFTTSLPVPSTGLSSRLVIQSSVEEAQSDEETLVQSSQPRLRLRGGAGSHTRTAEDTASPVRPFDITSEEERQDGEGIGGQSTSKDKGKSKGKGKQRESSQSPVQSSDHDDDRDDYDQYSGPSRKHSMARRRETRKDVSNRASSHQSRESRGKGKQRESSRSTVRSFNHDNMQSDPRKGYYSRSIRRETRNQDSSQASSHRNRETEVRVQGDPHRIRRMRGRRTSLHDEEQANLADPNEVIIHIRRYRQGRRRVSIHVEGLEDRFHCRERDNDMSDSEIGAHIVASLGIRWISRRRPSSPSVEPSPSCKLCTIS